MADPPAISSATVRDHVDVVQSAALRELLLVIDFQEDTAKTLKHLASFASVPHTTFEAENARHLEPDATAQAAICLGPVSLPGHPNSRA